MVDNVDIASSRKQTELEETDEMGRRKEGGRVRAKEQNSLTAPHRCGEERFVLRPPWE